MASREKHPKKQGFFSTEPLKSRKRKEKRTKNKENRKTPKTRRKKNKDWRVRLVVKTDKPRIGNAGNGFSNGGC